MSANKLPILIVDGYNLLLSSNAFAIPPDQPKNSPDPYHLATDPFDKLRAQLIADVVVFARRKYQPIIVFDGTNNKSEERPVIKDNNATVIFSNQKQTADERIEELLVELEQVGQEITVVTSDLTIRAIAKGHGAHTLTSDIIGHELQVQAAEIEESLTASNRTRPTIQDGLTEETKQKLRELLGKKLRKL